MIRLGIVGLGHNGIAHIEAHRRVGKSQLVALCDANAARLEAAGRRFGVERLLRDAEELCGMPDIDAVSINTGDQFHVEPFMAALRAGKHILVEKPLANSMEQVEEMVGAARRAFRDRMAVGKPPLVVAVGYVLRFDPVYEVVRSLCASGRLGSLFYLEGDYVHNLLSQAEQTDPETGANWYLEHERPMVGGGSHPLDLLRWFSGSEVVEVTGFSNRIAFPAMRNDDCQAALFRFGNGAVAKVAALYAPRRDMAPYYNLRVYGTGGTVERDMVAVSRGAADVHPQFRPIEAPRVEGHPFDPEVENWLEAAEGRGKVRCGLFDGANSTSAALAACESMRLGRTIAVPVYAQ